MEYTFELNNNLILTKKSAYANHSAISENLSFHFAFNGKENFTLNEKKLSVFPNFYLAMNPGTSYIRKVKSPEPVQLLSIFFDKEFVSAFENSCTLKDTLLLDGLNEPREIAVIETLYPFIGNMKYNICHLHQLMADRSEDDLLINEHLYHTLLNYHMFFRKELFQIDRRFGSLKKGTREEIYRRLNLAKEYLYSNYDQNISLQQLATYSCLSVTHLIRTFRQAFHMTPYQFLMRIRLNRAKYLLNKTDHPVSEVVNIIGLDSTSTFIKLFKQRYHTTPLQFRRAYMPN